MAKRIPLYGKYVDFGQGERRGIVIQSSDCEAYAAPPQVSEKHIELQSMIDRRRVPKSEKVGYIEHENGEVVAWELNEGLLKPEYQ